MVRQLVCVRALRAPPAIRASASSAWARRWWRMLFVAVQRPVGGTALGCAWLLSLTAVGHEPELDRVLELADPEGPCRLPLRQRVGRPTTQAAGFASHKKRVMHIHATRGHCHPFKAHSLPFACSVEFCLPAIFACQVGTDYSMPTLQSAS